MAYGGLATLAAPACIRVYASSSSRIRRPPLPPRSVNGSKTVKQPSVVEVQRAIGIADNDMVQQLSSTSSTSSSSSSSSSSFMDLLASTPIGQAESPIERKAREIAEWTAEHAEAHGRHGQQILLVVCLNILPVWLFFMLIASGLVNLPFELPFMNDLLA